jgi:glycosyltransferase involved in cell wall biosynthesis
MIAPQPFYSERGTPMNVRMLCQVLGEAGHKIDVLVFPSGEDIKLRNLRIIRLPNILGGKFIPIGPSLIKLFYDTVMLPAVFWLLVTNRYDVIHGIEEGGFLGVILGKLLGIDSIFDMDSSIPEQLKSSGFFKNPILISWLGALEKWSLNKSSCVITMCKALSDKAKQISPKANLFQIEDIPVSNFSIFDHKNVDELKKRYGLNNMTIILYTGNLEAYQGIDLLLDSWKVFCSQSNNMENCKLVVVGGNNKQITDYRNKTSIMGIQNSICWVGPRPLEEMGDWMEMSSALISPRTKGENTPLKIYSYMSSHRPIIATRLDTHTQVLDDSIAFLADPDPIQFSQAISDVLNETELAKKKAAKAKEVVEANYNYETFRRKLLKAYESLHGNENIKMKN